MATKNIAVTRRDVIAKAIEMPAGVWTPEELEVLVKMLASLEKPRKKSDEPTKAQVINNNLADSLVNTMQAHGEPVTVKWITEHVNGSNTPQKAVAVTRVAGERIVKFYEGRQVFYRLA